MLPVQLAVEPDDFDSEVRQPGTVYLNSLPSLVDVKFEGRKYWRRSMVQLRQAYSCICAYTCHWVALDVGGNSVEHFVPKHLDASRAYEWSNFRFVASRLNARRGIKTIIDPFLVQQDMFEIDFPTLLVGVSAAHSGNTLLQDTIKILKLNDDKIIVSRDYYVRYYANNDISIKFLRENAPLIHREIKRQKLLRRDLRSMGF
ncbi:hypothetical protein [Mesorhizobium sp. LSHC422A00]|uniref:hypothetical protein n=1 Tax=Mesorhizobium sp. LSHC422A00 TaxID=1287294 RepID=UPI0012EBEFDD|nr:hypothetical protein [Mesorhizobium sp. LSHC422A00]